MKKIFFIIFFVAAFESTYSGKCNASDINENPIDSVNKLVDAYKQNNLNDVLNSFDFYTSAKLLNEKFNLGSKTEELAEELKNNVKKLYLKSGFPNYNNRTCRYDDFRYISRKLATVREVCKSNVTHKSVSRSKYYMYKENKNSEWKVLNGIVWDISEDQGKDQGARIHKN